MTGYTPIYNLPYPQASDLVSAYPGTGQDLAEEVETVLAAKADVSSVKILQVIAATYATVVSTNSSTYADTGLTATITPSSNTNKVLVLVNQVGLVKETNNTWVDLILVRGTTNIATFGTSIARTASTAFSGVGGNGISYLDSPATTSAVTYKTQFRSNQNNAVAYVNFESAVSSIVLLEVKA